jgi:hypothetical protein
VVGRSNPANPNPASVGPGGSPPCSGSSLNSDFHFWPGNSKRDARNASRRGYWTLNHLRQTCVGLSPPLPAARKQAQQTACNAHVVRYRAHDRALANHFKQRFSLVLPKSLEPIRRQRGVAHRRGDRAVPQIMLDRSGVLTVVGQLVAAAVAQHVAVDKKPELGRLAGPGNHALVAGDAERRPALRHEHVRAGCRRFPLQPPQGSNSIQRIAIGRDDPRGCVF